MPRLVRFDATGPVKLEPREKPYFVCACGLSRTFPLCDGTHKTACPAEPPGKLCIYDDTRSAIIETRDEPPPASQPV